MPENSFHNETETALENSPDGRESIASRRAARTKRDRSAESFRRRFYQFSSLAKYKLRDRMLIRAADLLFYWLIKLICSTVRWEVRGMDRLDEALARGNRVIFTSWHACIFSATWFWRRRGIVVMSSQSRDAEYIGRIIKRFGYGTARGSATRGGQRALVEMAGCLENGIDAGFTIDGPRGPAYVAKSGAVTLARHTGQAILPFHITARRYFSLPTWDRLQMPTLFTRAIVLIAEPIYVPRVASREVIESKQIQLQTVLDHLRAQGEAWRKQRD